MMFLYLILFVKLVIAEDNNSMIDTFRLPAEWEPHLRTFMAWPQSEKVWSAELLPGVREDITNIANAVVNFEPVVMFADASQVSAAQSQLDKRVTVLAMPVDDFWTRDILPVFVIRKNVLSERLVGVNFNFNGWGKKGPTEKDDELAKHVLEVFRIESRTAGMVAEGGSFETDGRGTLLVTKSSVVNTNRNTKSMDEIEMELKSVLGVKKVIWFEGVRGEDITDAHIDSLVRFVRPGVVIMNRSFPGEPSDVWSNSADDVISVLKNATDADGNSFQIFYLDEPDPEKITFEGDYSTFLSSYTNFFIGNGCVIVPAFGDEEADLAAQNTLQMLFPDRKVVSVLLGTLASGGGGIHCATHQEPYVVERALVNLASTDTTLRLSFFLLETCSLFSLLFMYCHWFHI